MFAGGSPREKDRSDSPYRSLKVLETYRNDAGPGVIALDEATMLSIEARIGDIVEIQGKKKALAKTTLLHPSDSGRKIARIDEDTRKIAGVAVGGNVVIRRVQDLQTAERITLIPLNPIPAVEEQYLSDELDGVPLMNNTEIMIPYMGARLPFRVGEILTHPSFTENPSAIVTQKTAIIIRPNHA